MNAKTTFGNNASHETCVLIATPGRLWDLMQRGSLRCNKLEVRACVRGAMARSVQCAAYPTWVC